MVRLQFVCERAFTSYVISWFSSGHLSHVDAIEPDGRLYGARSDWVGSIPPGVQSRPPDYAKFSRRVVFEIPATAAQTARFWQFQYAQRGKPYDREVILAFLFDRDWRAPDHWICSEDQAAALEWAGIIRPLYLAANKITPVALALAVSAAGAIVAPPARA